ncbi:hypothetical protein DEU33_0441 [Kocuria sp. AG109]|nr:hypothetical protein DEU33_0441 [Kocuria sp. AG109]
MTFIALVLSLTAAFIGAVTCLRVPLASARRRMAWAAVLLALLVVCAVLLLADPGTLAGQAPSLGAVEVLLLVLGCAGAAVPGGSVVSAAVLGLAHRTTIPDGSAGPSEPQDPERDPVLRGGQWIGLLERAAVFAALLLGWPAGLGVIAAIKGLGRLGQLRGGAGAERFIVGTFASVLWAAAWAGLAWLAVRGAAHGALGFTS